MSLPTTGGHRPSIGRTNHAPCTLASCSPNLVKHTVLSTMPSRSDAVTRPHHHRPLPATGGNHLVSKPVPELPSPSRGPVRVSGRLSEQNRSAGWGGDRLTDSPSGRTSAGQGS
jgi:hypothetical protein